MLFLEKPEDYNPKHVITICVLECEEKILLLKRKDESFKGGMWDLPGGKIGLGESLSESMSREIFEETAIIVPQSELIFVKETFVRYPEFDFTSNLFYYHLKEKPEVTISPNEHTDYGWFTYEEALSMDMVPDEAERIKIVIDNIGAK